MPSATPPTAPIVTAHRSVSARVQPPRGWLDDPRFRARLAEASPASDLVWVTALATGLTFTLIAAFAVPSGSPSGKFWAYARLFIRGGLYLWAGDRYRTRGGPLLSRLFAMGLVAGVGELLVDWALIHWLPTGRLVYLTGNDVVLLGSPVWMPLAWACVIVELGYPALRLYGFLRARVRTAVAAVGASVAIGVGAGLTVGFYEYFAFRATWWRYEPAHAMLGQFCALYVPVGECLMFLFVLPIAARMLARGGERARAATLEGGVLFTLAIAAGYGLAYLALEAGRTA